jgi:hypothetical protein
LGSPGFTEKKKKAGNVFALSLKDLVSCAGFIVDV